MSFYTYIVMEKYWSCFKISFHDSKKANGKEEKGCRIGKQGFEAAVLPGGVPFRCQALQRSNSWDLSELTYVRQQTGRCLQKEEYHGGDFRLQMAEKRYGAGGNRRGKRGNLPERRAAGMGHLQHGQMGKPGCAETEKAI